MFKVSSLALEIIQGRFFWGGAGWRVAEKYFFNPLSTSAMFQQRLKKGPLGV